VLRIPTFWNIRTSATPTSEAPCGHRSQAKCAARGGSLRGLRGGDRAPAVIAVSPSIVAAPDAQVLPNSASGSRSTPRVTSQRVGAHHRRAAQGPPTKDGPVQRRHYHSRPSAYALSEDMVNPRTTLPPREPALASSRWMLASRRSVSLDSPTMWRAPCALPRLPGLLVARHKTVSGR
jgi:hypothetical protein